MRRIEEARNLMAVHTHTHTHTHTGSLKDNLEWNKKDRRIQGYSYAKLA